MLDLWRRQRRGRSIRTGRRRRGARFRTSSKRWTDPTRTKAAAAIKLLEARGNQLRGPHSKQIEADLWELQRGQVRIAYMFRPGRRAILLDGWLKKTDRIPRHILDRVRAMRDEVEKRDRERGRKE